MVNGDGFSGAPPRVRNHHSLAAQGTCGSNLHLGSAPLSHLQNVIPYPKAPKVIYDLWMLISTSFMGLQPNTLPNL